MRWVLPLQPPDFVYFFFDFQTFKIVELWFVTLKGAVYVVFSSSGIRLFGLQGKISIFSIRVLTLSHCSYTTLSSIFSVPSKVLNRWNLTAGSRWKMTTLPPLSPVASRSPSWLNSTQEMMSAERLIDR